MKIKPEDLARLRAAITPHDTPERRQKYLSGDFRNAAKVRNLEMRYRWDLLWASKLKIGDGRGVPGDLHLYAYMTDNNIDTALKSIVPPLKGEKP